MRPVLFADLDDTLFRSLSRFGGETRGMTQVTTAKNGNHSWMTPRQSMFLDWAMAALEVIPVTARSREAYARVSLSFSGPAVLSNGALIIDCNGRTDPIWQERTAEISNRFSRLLNDMLRTLQVAVHAQNIRAWIISEEDRDIYLCVKSNNSAELVDRDLDMAACILSESFDLAGLKVHRNANNLSLTPNELSKAAAVTHLLETRPELAERILFGAGDSLTDLHFMSMADFMMVPPTSQIAKSLDIPAPKQDCIIARDPLPVGTAGSGSYDHDDVRFLMKVVDLAPVGIEEKERLIQSGKQHYSEMISVERRPDFRYLELFESACKTNIPRIAREMAGIATILVEHARSIGPHKRLALCSLVRAGVPYGVILSRELKHRGVDVTHFGVSIIRDKGLDTNAIKAVLQHFLPEEVVFVDGWTGKGAIASELDRSWRTLTGQKPCLVVLADPCGRADICGSHDDWLIPSGILGGIVSGLISRSILNAEIISGSDFHGCLRLENMRDLDHSKAFVGAVCDAIAGYRAGTRGSLPDAALKAQLRSASEDCVGKILREFGATSHNLIKPGIAEATRAVLRRKPERVFLRSANDPDVAALRHLCDIDCVEMTIDPALTGPYRAITLIRRSA